MTRIRTTRQAKRCRAIALWRRQEHVTTMAESYESAVFNEHEMNREYAEAFLAKREQIHRDERES
jgi:hypothetical protein